MPLEINDCDGGIGNIIVSQGTVTDQELIDSFQRHLTDNIERVKGYKYILINHDKLAYWRNISSLPPISQYLLI